MGTVFLAGTLQVAMNVLVPMVTTFQRMEKPLVKVNKAHQYQSWLTVCTYVVLGTHPSVICFQL